MNMDYYDEIMAQVEAGRAQALRNERRRPAYWLGLVFFFPYRVLTSWRCNRLRRRLEAKGISVGVIAFEPGSGATLRLLRRVAENHGM